LIGATGANHIWWLNTNPFPGLLLHPIFIASCTYLLVTAIDFPFYGFAFVTGNKMKIIDGVGCGRCQSKLVVLNQPLFRFTAAPKLLN
jgi:hypothetical protein